MNKSVDSEKTSSGSTESKNSTELKETLETKIVEKECDASFDDQKSGDSPPQEEDSHSMVGESIAGYTIESFLGSGGMGEVYRAEQVDTGNVYAIKVLRKELLKDKSSKKRFEQEANHWLKIKLLAMKLLINQPTQVNLSQLLKIILIA